MMYTMNPCLLEHQPDFVPTWWSMGLLVEVWETIWRVVRPINGYGHVEVWMSTGLQNAMVKLNNKLWSNNWTHIDFKSHQKDTLSILKTLFLDQIEVQPPFLPKLRFLTTKSHKKESMKCQVIQTVLISAEENLHLPRHQFWRSACGRWWKYIHHTSWTCDMNGISAKVLFLSKPSENTVRSGGWLPGKTIQKLPTFSKQQFMQIPNLLPSQWCPLQPPGSRTPKKFDIIPFWIHKECELHVCLAADHKFWLLLSGMKRWWLPCSSAFLKRKIVRHGDLKENCISIEASTTT